ncbi:MAG: sugar phosphate isomerase/epimerase [Lachnospiraceae bacterium]|jgi:sugar phosphate isomerase/epimerase|nr:sugar phosphate isomerase/epimerase [Lachnospiraceae bacterium]
MSDIRLSLTLYALSAEYTTGRFTLEDCLRKAAQMGYTGIEMVASQMVPEYPYPSRAWMDHFKELLAKYDLHPVCYSAYIDMGTHADRDLSEAEIVESTRADLEYASYMGFDIVRTQHAISPKIYRQMLPYAAKVGVPLTIEMHHPHNPTVPVWQEYLRIMKEEPEYSGVVPDFSIFAEHPHKLEKIQAVEDFGCRPEMVEEITARHTAGDSEEEMLQGDYTVPEKNYVKELFETYGDGHAHLEWLNEVLPYTRYIHGKFWYLDEDEIDRTIPCDKLLPLIKKAGYSGYMASEYEGHHFSETLNSCEQLQRWVNMSRRILASC